MTTFNEYMEETDRTAIYPDAGEGTVEAINYAILGLVGEVGALPNKFKKVFRDHDGELPNDLRALMKAELGDALWYVARVCREMEWDFDELAEENIEKLLDRSRRGVLNGFGSNR